MTIRRTSSGEMALVLAIVITGTLLAQTSSGEEAAELVAQLPTNDAARENAELEKQIAAMGAKALPALQKELHLGIPFRKLNILLKEGKSRRYAVVRVLARIQSNESTDLLIRCLPDSPDNHAMRLTTLTALSKRTLSTNQMVAMLKHHEPHVVLAGMDHANCSLSDAEIKAMVETLFDQEAALRQFRNEYGKSTANPDALWEVRLAMGHALKRNMIPEMRDRAKRVLGVLQQEAVHPTEPNRPAPMSYGSRAENTIGQCFGKLAALGDPVKDLVQKARRNAQGDQAKLLDMALARLGNRASVPLVADHLTSSQSHTIRFCAAMTLRIVGDRSAIPALKRALRDPYHRQDGSCLRMGDGEIYPVRIVAADALIEMGEDPEKVRREMRR